MGPHTCGSHTVHYTTLPLLLMTLRLTHVSVQAPKFRCAVSFATALSWVMDHWLNGLTLTRCPCPAASSTSAGPTSSGCKVEFQVSNSVKVILKEPV